MREWTKEEWLANLRRVGVSPMAFAAAANISWSTLQKIFKMDPKRLPHPNTLGRVEDVFKRLEAESKAAG